MKKIGVITINDFNNYGNRLQCYAVQRSLEKRGYLVENIYNENYGEGLLRRLGGALLRGIGTLGNRKRIAARKKNFLAFHANIRFSDERIINRRYDKRLNEKYDYFVTGSDQVWNPCDSGRSEIDFLSFASEEKRISFAASIGVSELPPAAKDLFARYLKPYKSLSVREESAKAIVEALTGRTDVAVLADPTLLLTAEEWEEVSEKPELPLPKRYILSYFLSGSKAQKEIVSRIAEAQGCEIADIYDPSSVYYTCGPQHFLYLVKNAALICTDSFHASVFSFLYNRPFLVFDRVHTKMNMNTRLHTFLSEFGLQSCAYREGQDIADGFARDYAYGYAQLAKKREEAEEFLARAFS